MMSANTQHAVMSCASAGSQKLRVGFASLLENSFLSANDPETAID